MVQLYLHVKSELDKKLPKGFHPRLILANSAKNKQKHGFIVQLRTPLAKYVVSRSHMVQYCNKNRLNFENFDIKFRYFLKNYHFQSKLHPKDRQKIIFRYCQQILKDERSGIFSVKCCQKQFCVKRHFEEHRRHCHPRIVCID